MSRYLLPLLARCLNAFDGEEESVQEEHEDLIHDLRVALRGQPTVDGDEPRPLTGPELTAVIDIMADTGHTRDDIIGWLAHSIVFPHHMPDSPGYAGRVAVVLWSGGNATTFGFNADGTAFILGETA